MEGMEERTVAAQTVDDEDSYVDSGLSLPLSRPWEFQTVALWPHHFTYNPRRGWRALWLTVG
jgi:hypothetical protein